MHNKTVFRIHAVRRMFERNFSIEDVNSALENGLVLESYPDDKPYPSCLILGWIESRPVHIVVAENAEENEKIIITVYEPDHTQWSEDFTRRLQV